MMSWHQYPWRPLALLFLLAAQLRLASLNQCDKNTYSLGGKCCQYCQPGFGMVKRCTNKEDTQCQRCEEGFFSEGRIYYSCNPCTKCNVGSGSRVWQRCNSSRDTVCQCTAGTQPVEAFKQGVECSRCPLGHFSPGGNTKCKPWTNCTALGKRTLRAGSSEADADCEDPDVPRPPRSPPTSPRTSTPGSSPTSASRAATQSLRPDPKPRPDRDLFPLSVIFLAALVLLVSGFILLLLIAFFCRRDKRLALCKLSGTNSCRMPIQEEHQPSLAKV